MPFTTLMMSAPPGTHSACIENPEKPVTVEDIAEDGEKTPKEYRTAATITMTSMAQPYVIMYSSADWDLRGRLIQ